jgi:hypothetical protein
MQRPLIRSPLDIKLQLPKVTTPPLPRAGVKNPRRPAPSRGQFSSRFRCSSVRAQAAHWRQSRANLWSSSTVVLRPPFFSGSATGLSSVSAAVGPQQFGRIYERHASRIKTAVSAHSVGNTTSVLLQRSTEPRAPSLRSPTIGAAPAFLLATTGESRLKAPPQPKQKEGGYSRPPTHSKMRR